MKKYIFITIITIIITKLLLLLTWDTALITTQRNDSWHHMYTGLILMFPLYAFRNKFAKVLFYIGLGLVLDEMVHLFHMLNIVGPIDYWSAFSYLSTIGGLIAMIFILNKYDEL